jgi:hypothetical protein
VLTQYRSRGVPIGSPQSCLLSRTSRKRQQKRLKDNLETAKTRLANIMSQVCSHCFMSLIWGRHRQELELHVMFSTQLTADLRQMFLPVCSFVRLTGHMSRWGTAQQIRMEEFRPGRGPRILPSPSPTLSLREVSTKSYSQLRRTTKR